MDLSIAAKRIVQAKFANAGQTCIAPDYIMAHVDIVDRLVAALTAEIATQFGEHPELSTEYARIINKGHFERIQAYLEDGKVLAGGRADASENYIAPTLMLVQDSDKQKAILEEEIFGPVLPILAVPSMRDAIAYINMRPKPLAAYVFSTKQSTIDAVLGETTSGSACVNDCMYQFLNPNLPFGGVGPSGVGAYHGKASFEEFSHRKSVLAHLTWLDRLPYVLLLLLACLLLCRTVSSFMSVLISFLT
eukprot:SAG31_NODE_139_length_22847_cov_8.142474_8_plen_248_part_00